MLAATERIGLVIRKARNQGFVGKSCRATAGIVDYTIRTSSSRLASSPGKSGSVGAHFAQLLDLLGIPPKVRPVSWEIHFGFHIATIDVLADWGRAAAAALVPRVSLGDQFHSIDSGRQVPGHKPSLRMTRKRPAGRPTPSDESAPAATQ